MNLFKIYCDDEPICIVVASTHGKAKSLALKDSQKARDGYDYISLRCTRINPKEYLDDRNEMLYPHVVWDFETPRDVLAEELRWYWATR